MDDTTIDTFFDGKVTVEQPRSGYRYSIDAVILAGQVLPRSEDRIVDLGTGCGIIPLILGFRHRGIRLYGVELQQELADIARINVAANQLEGRVVIVPTDLRQFKPGDISGPVDLVVSNPPFHRMLAGRINPDNQKAIARHEIKVTLEDVLEAAERLLRTAGKFMCIYGVDRLVELLVRMRRCHIEPKFLRMIHSRSGSDARLVLVEGVKRGNGGLTAGPPLFIYGDDGEYTPEIRRMFLPTP